MGFGDFFRDYGTPFAMAVAVINTVISVTIGQYFKDSPRARAVLVAASIMFGTVAIGASFYSQHEIVGARDAEAAHRLEIREVLGLFVAEGDDLMERCMNS